MSDVEQTIAVSRPSGVLDLDGWFVTVRCGDEARSEWYATRAEAMERAAELAGVKL